MSDVLNVHICKGIDFQQEFLHLLTVKIAWFPRHHQHLPFLGGLSVSHSQISPDLFGNSSPSLMAMTATRTSNLLMDQDVKQILAQLLQICQELNIILTTAIQKPLDSYVNLGVVYICALVDDLPKHQVPTVLRANLVLWDQVYTRLHPGTLREALRQAEFS